MTRGQVASPEERSSIPAQGETLASAFADSCARWGQRTALSFGAESMSYAELDAAAGCVAPGLAARGIGPGALVAICMERSSAMIVAMLGVVRAGAAYLPLDSRYPAARLAETLADARPACVLVARRDGLALAGLAIEDLLLATGPVAEIAIAPDDLAYVIYTSGSTGKPKGVRVSQHNVVRLLRATERLFGFDEHDVWTMFHSFAFDFSVWEIWGALLYGGRLVIVPYAVSRAPGEFHALLAAERVTVLNQTPSAFALLDAADAASSDSLALRLIIFGGEALAGAALRGWLARHGDALPQLVNMYGITETTVHVTYRRMRARDAAECESLLGEPLDDLTLELLDEHMRPVTDGSEGEICVGGAGVALGYLDRPELTAERFVVDGRGGRMYRSGDLARRRADGELVYLSRRDGQVKINGFRIETGEVEAALRQQSGIAQACVVARPGPGGALRLVAYFTGAAHASASLRELLAARLPAHMLPSLYQRVDAFPLNANGKIDRQALPEPHVKALPRQVGNAAEQKVAEVWERLLALATVGLDDNFFEVGGTSLLLIAARAGLEQAFARSIPVTWMFELTTVRSLAARLAAAADDGRPEASPQSTGISNAAQQRQAFARAKSQRGAR